ncbi:hypothetical protein C0J52_03030 [Blattella germanica]|nr:hypothetical protein C0J52_03030 [Blattella germanica]
MAFSYNEIIVIFQVLFILNQRTVMGLDCYLCDSETNHNCGSKVNRRTVETINCANYFALIGIGFVSHPSVYACQKLQVKDSTNGNITTVRQCVIFDDETRTLCDVETSGHFLSLLNITLEYCGVCRGDLCNSGRKNELSATLMYLVTAIVTLLN